MGAAIHPMKTLAGQAELVTRARRVSQRHRTVLFLVDGRRSTADVRAMAAQAGVPDHCFDELLVMGLIALPVLVADVGPGARAAVGVDGPLPLPGPLGTASATATDLDSLLPPSRTLSPESIAGDSRFDDSRLDDAWRQVRTDTDGSPDQAVEEAREILVRAVRGAAPVAGSITLLRLRRARSRHDLLALLDEVEARISRPHRSLSAAQTVRRVRDLLDGRANAAQPS